MPFWDRSLDLVILTRADDAHLAGLVEGLERYDVRQVVQVKAPDKPNATYQRWQELIAEKRVPSIPTQEGLTIQIEPGVRLEVLYPSAGEVPDAAVMRLQANSLSVLFVDSLDEERQATLLESDVDLASDLWLPPRQVTLELLDAVNPRLTVLFVGSASREKPSAESISVLAGTTVLRTDERGTIEFVVDEAGARIKTEK